MKRNVVITGAYGFIGSNFVNLHRNKFDKVILIDKMTYAASLENVHKKVDHVSYIDINDVSHKEFKSILKSVGVDTDDSIVIVNFAAESHVDNSIGSSKIFVESNVLGTHNLLDLMLQRKNTNDTFIQISTDEVTGSIEDGEFFEDSPLRPNNPYSATKAAAEMLAFSFFKTHGMDTRITRCCNNYGPNQAYEKFIPVVISSMINGDDIPVYGNGENIREWIHVSDHCSGILSTIEKGKPGEVYNIGSGDECSNIEMITILAKLVSKKLGTDIEDYLKLITFVDDRPGHDLRYSINCDKIKTQLNWVPKIELEKGLKTTVDYYVSKNESF